MADPILTHLEYLRNLARKDAKLDKENWLRLDEFMKDTGTEKDDCTPEFYERFAKHAEAVSKKAQETGDVYRRVYQEEMEKVYRGLGERKKGWLGDRAKAEREDRERRERLEMARKEEKGDTLEGNGAREVKGWFERWGFGWREKEKLEEVKYDEEDREEMEMEEVEEAEKEEEEWKGFGRPDSFVWIGGKWMLRRTFEPAPTRLGKTSQPPPLPLDASLCSPARLHRELPPGWIYLFG